MAKFTYTEFLGEYGALQFMYSQENLFLDVHKPATAVYTDEDGGEHIVLKGTDLTYDMETGKIVGGNIDKIVFENSDGSAMVTMTEGDFGGKALTKILFSENGVIRFLDKIRSGDDTVTGSPISDYVVGGMGNDKLFGLGGDDTLDGGRGNDRFTGGKGSDSFVFGAFYDKDVVTDFDANGGETIRIISALTEMTSSRSPSPAMTSSSISTMAIR
jgi:Ca2+-binding RTX toxin-like protein